MKRADVLDALTPRNHSFGLPLLVTMTTVAWEVASPDGAWSRTITITLFCSAILLTMHAAEAVARRRHVSIAIVALALGLMVWGNAVPDAERLRGLGELVIAIPLVLAAAKVIHWVGRQPIINGQCVLGGVLVYMLAGLMFAQIYGAVIDLTPGSDFFCNLKDSQVSQSDRVYFSFSTITTTGFGDFVSCTRGGHAISMTEAVFGQVYLVTIIALLVGNMGRRRNSVDPAEPSDD